MLGPATEPEAQTTSITKAGLAVKAAPITRRGRRQKREKKHSTHGSWKLVYADFVTVLMAFFIVCWVILFDNVSKREKIDLSCIKPLSEALQKQIAEKLGFRLVDHRMELYGVAIERPV